MCKSQFDTNWRGISGKLKPEYASGFILNHRTKSSMKVGELDSKLNDAYIEGLYAKEQDFMYTGQDAALKCMDSLIRNDIRTVHYRNMEECTKVVKNIGNMQAEIVDDYCMPELTAGPEK